MIKKIITLALFIGFGSMLFAADLSQASFTDIKGNSIAMQQNSKGTLVVFWATWCQSCLYEIPHLIELLDSYQDQGLRILSISVDDDQAKLHRFVNKTQLPYPVIHESTVPSGLFPSVRSIPTIFYINQDLSIVDATVGSVSHSKLENRVRALLGLPINEKPWYKRLLGF